MNVLIQVGGQGSVDLNGQAIHFEPLMKFDGKPMIQVVVENLNIDPKQTYLYSSERTL